MTTIKYLFLTLAIIGSTIIFPQISYADIVTSQIIHTDSQNFVNDATHTYIQSLGLLNTIIGSADVYTKYNIASTRNLQIQLCDNADYATALNCTNGSNQSSVEFLSGTNTKTLDHVTFSPAITVNNQYAYLLIQSGGGVSNLTLYGSNSNTYSNGEFTIALSGTETLADWYFVLYTGSTADTSNIQPTVTWINPTNHATTTSGNINFEFDYITEPLSFINQYTLTVYDISSSPPTTFYSATGTISTATGTINKTINLTTDHLYMACVNLSNPGISDVSYNTPCITFTTGATFSIGYNTSIETAGLIPFGSGTNGCDPPSNLLDVGGGLTYAFCTLFIPSNNVLNQYASIPTLIASKFPFSYISSLQDAFTAVSDQSASTTPGASFTFPLGASFTNPGGGSATTTFSIFNPSTIVASVPLITTMRTYISYIIYFMFGIFAFRRVMKLI